MTEILVVIAVIVVLIAILLPALAGVRRHADHIKVLAGLNQSAAAFDFYAERADDMFPYQGPDEPFRINPDASQDTLWTSGAPWALETLWVALLHDAAPWREYYSLWVDAEHADNPEPWDGCPVETEYCWVPPSVYYSNSFVASPWTWGGPADRAEKRATRRYEVRFPSDKVLLYRRMELDEPTHARLFVDGSADRAADATVAGPEQNLFRIGLSPRIYRDTAEGVLGRDR